MTCIPATVSCCGKGETTPVSMPWAVSTGTPELRPTPDFRPESAGEQEYRVDVLIERHVLPPITRDEAREHPVLADLDVLHRPWGGTNLSMTRDQWWAIRELAPLEPGQPTAVRWGPLVHWAARFAESVDFDAVERNYKLEIRDRLLAAREAMVAGEPEWPRLLRRAFGSPEQSDVLADARQVSGLG